VRVLALCPACERDAPVEDGCIAPHYPVQNGVPTACRAAGEPAASHVRRWAERERAQARLLLTGADGRRTRLLRAVSSARADLASHDEGVALAERSLATLETLLGALPPEDAS
jgi:hypothetical protein